MSELTAFGHSLSSGYEVVVIKPQSLSDTTLIVQALRADKAVILNLEHLDVTEAQRISDFAAGSTYAINGHQSRLGDGVFLFTPNVINIQESTAAPTPAGLA
ncbi:MULTISPECIES: cell division protein SepF [unclassified Thermosynechococcus]|uniref:cell division protein SepF n=1 Tax=unclassified Thermosynechococcus TaxID=2622553 RepID=UPI00122E2DC0|nr:MULTISPECIES: cell division protein SepF [unclassified Thermosynechococcus]MDR5640228.1 cell division protein SepF [Thermosynechococcus sp. PP42]MDR7897345.1 cell division protein SepF [Thermosynechococcus sp. JY1332]MDR7904748.1 cell division protein SepF [Thermosynechococcus sp. JY1334]MDR7923017.1 cell division protein SepF [Thermosynechococcus sp. HY213]MDR7992574.1 cell division protein SepF [Thermosynechococcus sp. TG252]